MRLENYLSSSKISISEFANKLGVSCQTVYRWMDGTRFPKRHLTQIYEASIGQVTPSDFIELPDLTNLANKSSKIKKVKKGGK